MTFHSASDPITLRAHCALSVDRPPVHDAYVTVDQGKIVAVERVADGPVRDLGDVILFPAPINCHTHLEFSDLDRPIGHAGIEFDQWVLQVVQYRASSRESNDGSKKTHRIQQGLDECLQWATSAVGDIATVPWNYSPRPKDPRVVSFLECISLSPASQGEWLKRLSEHSDWAQSHLNVVAGISPHAPYSVHPKLLDSLCQRAAIQGQPIAMHVAETQAELELLATGQGAMREMLEKLKAWDAAAFALPRDAQFYLERLQVAPRALVVHGNYLTGSQLAWLGQHRSGMSLVYCPRTHQFFRHEPYPIENALRTGVRVVLGTDSRASSPDLNVWQEARSCYSQYPRIAPEEILRMVTQDAAYALGVADRLGAITEGHDANLATVSWAGGLDDPWKAVFEADPTTIQTVPITQIG